MKALLPEKKEVQSSENVQKKPILMMPSCLRYESLVVRAFSDS